MTCNTRFGGAAIRAAALLVALLAGSRAAAAPADPAKSRRLAVVAFPTEPASAVAAARLAQQAEAAVRNVGRQELVELARVLDVAGTSARDAQAESGRNAAATARKFYDDLEPQKAAAECNKALKAFEGADLSGPAFDQMIAAWSLRVASLLANLENKAALAELGLMLPSGGRAVFDPNLFAPDFIAQIKSRRADLAMKGTLAYGVETRPVPALVYVDGTPRGVSPTVIEDLTPGEHFLTLVAPGHQFVQKRIRGGPGVSDTFTLETTLKQAPFQSKVDAFKAAIGTAARAEKLKAVAAELGVDQVLALAVTVQGKEMKVVAVRGGVDGQERSYLADTLPVEGEARPGEAAGLFLARVLGTDLKPPKGVPVAASESGGWTLRHTGILLIGLGAGAGGAGAGVGWQAKALNDSFKASKDAPQVNPIWDQRIQEGKNWALAADLTYAGAAVLAVVGTVLAIVGGSDEPAAEPARPSLRLEEKKPSEPAKAQPSPAEEKKPAEAAKPDDKPTPGDEKKRAAEERQAKAEEDKQRRAEEKRKAEEERKAEAERKAEEKRKAEEERKAEAERRAEEKRKAEEEKKARMEEDRQRKAEEKRKADEEKKAAAEAKKRAADEAMKSAEKEQQEAAAREYEEARKAEAERIKREEEAARKVEEERQAEIRRKEEERRLEREKQREADKKIRDFDDLRDDR